MLPSERSRLVEMRAAVDDDHLSGDAVVSAECHDLLRDVGSVRGAPKHHALARAIDHLGRDSLGHARALDKTGGDVDDAPASLPLHVRRGSARELKWPAHVGGEQTVPHFRGELVEVGEWHADVPGGIVDEKVETPEGLGGRADRGVDGLRFRLIEWEGAGAAAKPFDGLHRLSGALAVADVRESDIAAGARESDARRRAEITRSPRHQGYPPEEIHVHSKSCDVPRPPAGGLSGSSGRAVKTVIRARFGTP